MSLLASALAAVAALAEYLEVVLVERVGVSVDVMDAEVQGCAAALAAAVPGEDAGARPAHAGVV